MDRQQEFALRTVEERDVRFIRLWFTDVLGTLKSVAIAPAELEAAFEEGIGFDGSAIEGMTRVLEDDMIVKPDPSTFQILPWHGGPEGTARMFCLEYCVRFSSDMSRILSKVHYKEYEYSCSF